MQSPGRTVSSPPLHLTRSYYQPQLLASYERLPRIDTDQLTHLEDRGLESSSSAVELAEIRLPTHSSAASLPHSTTTTAEPTGQNSSLSVSDQKTHSDGFLQSSNNFNLSALPVLAVTTNSMPLPAHLSSLSIPKEHSPLTEVVDANDDPEGGIKSRLGAPATDLRNETGSGETTVMLDHSDFFDIVDFLLGLCGALQRYGMPTPRLEYQMTWVAESFGINAAVAVFPTYIAANFRQRNSHVSYSYNLSVEYSWDLRKLEQADAVAIKVAEHKFSLDDGIVELKKILEKAPLYPNWLRLIVFTLTSGIIAPLFFKGGLVELVASLATGFLVALMVLFGEKAPAFNRILEAVSSIVVSAIVTILDKTQVLGPINTTSIMLGAVVWCLPGLQINTATSDLATHMMVSGTSRLIFAFLIIFEMGFGFAIGSKVSVFMPEYASTGTDVTLIPSIPMSPWFAVLFIYCARSMCSCDRWQYL